MAQIKQPRPALLLIAAFSRHDAALAWARRRAEREFGPLALESGPFTFGETDYYTPTMGSPLTKRFFAFERLIDPGRLAEIKILTNQWEQQYADETAQATAQDGGDAPRGVEEARPQRPLNLDPGYLELAKLVLASTKDHAHRIYLGQGIYAEVTLQYRQSGGWQPQPWTFPDYRRADYHEFFDRCREYLRSRK